MFKMKRYLCLAVVLVFALSVMLSGCGGSKPTDAEKTSDAEVSTTGGDEESSVPKDTVEIKFYSVADTQPDMQKINDAATEYLKDKLNVKIIAENFGWGDTYTPKINPMLAAGEAIDVVFTSNWAANYRQNAVAGYFYELNGLLEKYPKIKEIVGADFLNGSAINGKNYAVPTNKEKVHNWGYLLKKDLVDKYKIDAANIKKMEDLEPYYEQIKANEPGITPLLTVQMDATWHLLDWDNISDDDIPGALYNDNRDTKIFNQFEAPESIAMYKKMREYYKKGYVHPDAATQDNVNEEMRSGKYFSVVQPLKPGKAEEMFTSTKIEWVQVDITPPIMSNRETIGALLAIPAKSKNPERAFQFIEMLYTDKFLKNLFVYGIENEHYTKVSDNVVKLTDNQGYMAGNGWRFGDQFKDYLLDNEDPEKWVKFEEYNNKGTALTSLGFAFDSSNVDNQASACKNVIQTYYKQLFCGAVDTDATVAKMSSELKAAGADELIAEMQKQYDAWLTETGKK
ncbi:carbohydrate ABC transporter substrate-binding protein (CUT1 family) [Anaerobacterium chartisolvens]|uniref:Carbohydrate ABC transporter substrate-binding protein (CUT1 family) n=1 Tax=Anaerobacterium chartisolvens TaxID=1297424 RepID=A0A369BAC5_9FIRM|nr:ABC transporter substrate-binding protein [Anaerobacterium chartisolvens]RCX17548.1 carbohydrate ABC transporter substrate-binding protein (CUT1 family) [Anaerobacterium chartisolvens]